MSLRIGRLETRCRAPRGQADLGAVVDTVARSGLPHSLAATLGPSLARQAAIVRLRRLNVRLRIDAASLRRGGLADAWATAFARALHQALARTDDDGQTLRRFASPADYRAEMIATLLAGDREAHWQFPELIEHGGRPPAILLGDLLFGCGPQLGAVLAQLQTAGVLAAALAPLDEVGLERLIRLAGEISAGSAALTAGQMLLIADALAQAATPLRGGDAVCRRQAIVVWLQLERRLPLRGVWHALRLLLWALEQPPPLATARVAASLPAEFPAWCGAILEHFAGDLAAPAQAALERLRHITPTAARAQSRSGRWIVSDCAGILLLCETLRRLGWPRAWTMAGLAPPVVQALLAGIAMRMLGDPARPQGWSPGDALDPAVGLLAGILGEPSCTGIGAVFNRITPAAVPDLSPGADWAGALDASADALAAAFAGRIRGFRAATRAATVRHFLRVPGRILVEPDTIRVVLRAFPFAVVLHVSGADGTLENLDWLGGRRVEFVLEGL